jgi:3-deoxy-D-manno-octulosonic-acid transferase
MKRNWGGEALYFLEQLLLLPVIAFLLVPWEVLRILAGTARWSDLHERLGQVTPTGGCTHLVHAVSVGEVRAAEALIAALPDHSTVILTVGNRAGRERAEHLRKRLPPIAAVRFLPWDSALLLRRFLHRLEPRAVVVLETEIWPALFRESRRSGAALIIASGRMPEPEARRYRLIRPLLASTLRQASMISAQTAEDAARFLALGADSGVVSVGGNLKIDLPPAPREGSDILLYLAEARRKALVVVAGSTHQGEEELLFSALKKLDRPGRAVRLVIAPRDPGRARSVVSQARRRGFVSTLSSAVTDSWSVLVIDRMGMLAQLYSEADVVIIGGSLVRRGGHNFLEAAACGTAIVAGPSMEHFAALTADFERHRAMVHLRHSRELEPELVRLLDDPRLRREMGVSALSLLEERRGVSLRVAERIDTLLRNHGAPGDLPATAEASTAAS